MRKSALISIAVLAALAMLPAPAGAAATNGGHVREPVKVEIEGVRLARPANGPESLLVGVRYPIQMDGHRASLRVKMRLPGEGIVHSWGYSPLLSAGPRREPDRRHAFDFVQRIDIDRALAAQIAAANGPPKVEVSVHSVLDANDDGTPELVSADRETHIAGDHPGAGCSDVQTLRVEPGQTVTARLPACSFAADWIVAEDGDHGSAHIHDGYLTYDADQGFRGTDSVELKIRRAGDAALASSTAGTETPVQVVVGTAQGASVRAIGDSVTAGFGYYGNGEEMSVFRLPSCKPAETFYDDACSSNSPTRSNAGKTVEYLPDYGLSNKVSWAAQWAGANGITNYENLAVSGSEPKDWLPGGQLYPTLQKMEAENPEYILMTLGANPILSEVLFGRGNIECAVYSDFFGNYKECVEKLFRGVELNQRLKAIYGELVANTTATVYVMQYQLSIPSIALTYTAEQIAEMGKTMNEEIARAAAEVGSPRLQVIAPPYFPTGLDLEPVYPADFECGRFITDKVDGESVQSTPTQLELRALHPVEFCGGPAEGPPWVIGGDTGIHPSAAGYAQMASRVPAPR
jgi:lysophospholipase L1-like esterase